MRSRCGLPVWQSISLDSYARASYLQLLTQGVSKSLPGFSNCWICLLASIANLTARVHDSDANDSIACHDLLVHAQQALPFFTVCTEAES